MIGIESAVPASADRGQSWSAPYAESGRAEASGYTRGIAFLARATPF